jgi:hypothetical protein
MRSGEVKDLDGGMSGTVDTSARYFVNCNGLIQIATMLKVRSQPPRAGSRTNPFLPARSPEGRETTGAGSESE